MVKEQWHVRGYVRYMDNMVLWSDTKAALRTMLRQSREFLREELRLELKPMPYLNRSRHGVDFLGCRVYPDRLTLNRRSRVRFRRKLLRLEEQYCRGEIPQWQLQQQATALVAFTRAPGLRSWRFRQETLQRLPVSGHKASTA